MLTEPSHSPVRHHEWRVFPAVILIAVGVLFLFNNLGYRLDFLFHGNWWAWFILIAAMAPLTRAFEVYRARRRLDAEATGYLLAAMAVALVAVMFLMGLDWFTWWPLFVILGGLFTLMRRPYHPHHHDAWASQRDDDDARFRR